MYSWNWAYHKRPGNELWVDPKIYRNVFIMSLILITLLLTPWSGNMSMSIQTFDVLKRFTHCLGIGHGTMVCAVCLFVLLLLNFRMIKFLNIFLRFHLLLSLGAHVLCHQWFCNYLVTSNRRQALSRTKDELVSNGETFDVYLCA